MKKETPYKIGKKYLVRTVTMIYTGKLVDIYDRELVFTNCAWIPETSRWADTVEKGIFNEVEPYPKNANVIIGKGAILDVTEVSWALPSEQK